MPPYWVACLPVAVPLAIYILFLGLAANPFFQRNFVYAHRIQTLWWTDVNEPQSWGFAKNQVTPFSLTTSDHETLYAWHILPLPLYSKHESELSAQSSGFHPNIEESLNFKLLSEDPSSRLVLYFHGNAGHVAQGFRPASYHVLTETSTYHILAIDYRGFGHSTGSPTEEGLILDASAAVDWALHTVGLPPDRIVLLGQSLGTAVTAAVAERYALQGVDFAGVVMVAGFSSLPTMLSGYAIAGWVPVLRPLKAIPFLLQTVLNFVVDKWESKQRLRDLVHTVKARSGRLRLHLVHARNDWDIPYLEDDKLFAAAVDGTIEGANGIDPRILAEEKEQRTVRKGKDAFVTMWKDGDVEIRQELFPTGGHNDVMTYAPVSLAVMRSFDLGGTADS
ncbi:alpha/beta-hydrolase [Coniochaeta ligniaria NRRL 30616]|uniref:Alpha/beta-hydrolase n=1 Tax=Coniochaeta ligniaria NRRL 30616 TaxID=1408157 RepID=A0A1J7IKK9_9PEZI|nr:alpha/beta-hydrolase [Coniochaeta ligniaria NRRL 30616]